MRTTQLRARFLAALAASGAIAASTVAACGGAVEGTGASSGSSGTSSSGHSSGGPTGSSGTTPSPSTSPSEPPVPPPLPPPQPTTCADGRKGSYTCYTYEQLVTSYQSRGGRGGDSADAGPPDPSLFDPNGCLPAKLVEDSCCNPARSGPYFDASSKTCCYLHCDGACCGRPFIVGGEAHVAGVLERSGWTSAPNAVRESPVSGTFATTVRSVALDADVRERIATAWARDAAMEHASVASFARFTLELLALGAPADLVIGAQEATRDEIEHALACFAIASRYAGRDLGPGKLDIGTTMPPVDLARSVEAAIVEGCIGETLSALLAEARVARAEDDDVRAALRRIANEEARHAELAWRFVGWAITTGGDEARGAASRAFDAALLRAPGSFDTSLRGVPAETLRAHGLLDEKAAHEVAVRTLHDVVGPCAAALLAAAGSVAA